MTEPEIDIYPVGLFDDLKRWAGNPDRPEAWRRLLRDLRFPLRMAWARNWQAARNYFNGFLAEPEPYPSGLKRCGSGWTRGRALRDLTRRFAQWVEETSR